MHSGKSIENMYKKGDIRSDSTQMVLRACALESAHNNTLMSGRLVSTAPQNQLGKD